MYHTSQLYAGLRKERDTSTRKLENGIANLSRTTDQPMEKLDRASLSRMIMGATS